MEGETVVCIGGASGMGRGVAEAAAARGAQVVVTSRTRKKAEDAAGQIGARGFAADLADDASMHALFDEVGRFDHLAVTAGATGRSSVSDTPPDEARTFMDTKLWATHACVWAAKDRLREEGSITLFSGGYAEAVTDEAVHVHVAFQAVEALARAVAVAFAPIRCNVVRPGFVDSALWDFMDEEERDALRAAERKRTLTGDLVTPRELGEAVVAIMTAKAITGATIPIDGGRRLTRES